MVPSGSRVPPHDLDAEAAVLSSIILDAAAFDRVQDGLRAEHFYADCNQRIYEAVVDLRLQGQPADVVLIADWLRSRGRLGQVGGTPYLAQIVDATPAVANIEEHAAIIREKWRLRQLIETSIAVTALAYAPVEDPQALLDAHEQAIAELTHTTTRLREEGVGLIYSRKIAEMSEARARGETFSGVRTGFSALDRLTGGLFASDLVVIAARPGLGKTAFVQSVACNVARPRSRGDKSEELGHAVLFLTLEQPREQMATRFASHEAEIDLKVWRRPRVTEDDWVRMINAMGKLESLPIWIDDTPALTLGDLRAKIRRLKRQIERGIELGTARVPSKGLFLVIVDYLQLMTGVRQHGDSREREVASLSAGLKVMAKQEHVCIIAVSQLNRGVEKNNDKRPKLSDLRESGAIEQDADTIGFLYREDYYDRETTERGTAELDVAKQRNGPPGTVQLKFRGLYTRYYNLAEEEFDEFDDFADSVVP